MNLSLVLNSSLRFVFTYMIHQREKDKKIGYVCSRELSPGRALRRLIDRKLVPFQTHRLDLLPGKHSRLQHDSLLSDMQGAKGEELPLLVCREHRRQVCCNNTFSQDLAESDLVDSQLRESVPGS